MKKKTVLRPFDTIKDNPISFFIKLFSWCGQTIQNCFAIPSNAFITALNNRQKTEINKTKIKDRNLNKRQKTKSQNWFSGKFF
jgi:hypothetical protein